MGKWNTALGSVDLQVLGAELAEPGRAIMGAGDWEWFIDRSGQMSASYTDRVLEAGTGDLFSFVYPGVGIPCLERPNGLLGGSWLTEPDGATLEDLKSPDWCDAPDEPLNSLRLVQRIPPAPPLEETIETLTLVVDPLETLIEFNALEWTLVAYADRAIHEVQAKFAPLDTWGGGMIDTELGWNAYDVDRQTYRAHMLDGEPLAGNQDHALFYVVGRDGEKPCIERGEFTYIWDEGARPLEFVSEDFCSADDDVADPMDYVGD
jgi:hypothetical protein